MRSPKPPTAASNALTHFLLLLIGSSGAGCFTAKINVVDERTALENQILGSYQELDSNLQLLASVRSGEDAKDGAADPRSRFSRARQRAIAARQTQLFLRDDVDEAKLAGCLGEGTDGLLAERACPALQDQGEAERIRKLLRAENQARDTVLKFIVLSSPDLGERDLPQVVSAFARIRREQAAEGEWIQEPTGEWKRKE